MAHCALPLAALLAVVMTPALAAAADVLITSPEDNKYLPSARSPAPAGSLREAIRDRAQPGDVIRFAEGLEVKLNWPLEIPAALEGLRIEGPGTIRGAEVIVRAPKVTVQ